jgi:hypothetical protein
MDNPVIMKILNTVLVLVGLGLTLLVATRSFKIPHKAYYDNQDSFVFTKGNASPELRHEIEQKLLQFQKGYEARDTSVLDYYMNDLFSQENILILGTMPLEIFSDYDGAFEVIRADWLQWGDVRLLIGNANISSHGEVAWISTIGFVETDLSRFLILPLRFTGVLVREDFGWKFQQAQYQFDLDNSFTVLAILLLWVLFLVGTIRLVYQLSKLFISRHRM